MTGEPIAFIDLAAQQARIRDDVDRRLAAVLDHGRYIMGPEVVELERELAAFSGVAEVVSCGSGTDALLMALMAGGVVPGDAVLVPSFTFAATAEVVALAGATPVFVDCREDSFNLDVDQLAPAVALARAGGLRPVAVIAVDLFGQLADYDAIAEAAEQLGLWVLADAAQSFGGEIRGRRAGGFGRMATTSFFPAKPLGCYGDGGAIFTDDAELAAVLRSIRVHGQGEDKYDNVRIGVNGRLDTVQAAILLAKMAVFADELVARQHVADTYRSAFAGLAGLVAPPVVGEGYRSAWAQYTIRIGTDRDAVAAALKQAGIPTAIYYPRPLHRQTAYRGFPVDEAGLPVSEQLATDVLSLPMHPYLEADDQERIVAAVTAAVEATR